MKAEQSKFLSSITSTVDGDSKSGLGESNSDDGQDLEESAQDVCSLCHDPNSKNPVSFLVLLQVRKIFICVLLSEIIDSYPSLKLLHCNLNSKLIFFPSVLGPRNQGFSASLTEVPHLGIKFGHLTRSNSLQPQMS